MIVLCNEVVLFLLKTLISESTMMKKSKDGSSEIIDDFKMKVAISEAYLFVFVQGSLLASFIF